MPDSLAGELQVSGDLAVALINFVAQLTGNPVGGLPTVPAALLTLMGVSATTYATTKALETTGTVVPTNVSE